MKKKTINSKYKIFGGLPLLIFVNLIFFLLTYKVLIFISEKASIADYQWQTNEILVFGFIILFQLLLLYMLMKECRYIKIDHEKIIFINPIFPFLKKTKYFYEYDYKQIVEEHANNNYYEAVWLIKNERLQDRISSFYYSNYEEIRDNLDIKDNGRLRINKFKQLGCLLGMKI